jgi:hypothetical protein
MSCAFSGFLIFLSFERCRDVRFDWRYDRSSDRIIDILVPGAVVAHNKYGSTI